VNFTDLSLFLTETNLVPGSKLWNQLRLNADTPSGHLRRTAAIGIIIVWYEEVFMLLNK